MLDIHGRNGQFALKAAGLYEEFLNIVHPGGQAARFLTKHGEVLLETPDDGRGDSPEVPRGALRQILLDALPGRMVRWGHKLVEATPLDNSCHQLRFANGQMLETDLLVGADGAWSMVRPLLSSAVPYYLGTASVETLLFDSDTRHAPTARLVGSGAMYALTPGKGILAHREPNGVLHTYVTFKKSKAWIDRIASSNPYAARALVAREFDGWASELVALITDGETPVVARSLHALPCDHYWDHVAGVTLLGDAAHLNPPDGEGANWAMYDGAELGRLLAEYQNDTEAAIRKYETALLPRMRQSAVEAHQTFESCFGDNAPVSLLGFSSPDHSTAGSSVRTHP
jgi:2-polyprenyl-6-methoxyphenol hydroxylase-like FAD-dependent oxidoreductase